MTTFAQVPTQVIHGYMSATLEPSSRYSALIGLLAMVPFLIHLCRFSSRTVSSQQQNYGERLIQSIALQTIRLLGDGDVR